MNAVPIRDVTPAQLRAEMLAKGMDISGVNFDELAKHINDKTTLVPGWIPPPPPKEWRETNRYVDTARYVNAGRRLTAMLSCTMHIEDGRAWMHLSISHPQRVPTHGEMRVCKEQFLGDRYAYAVWPPKTKYVNLHPYCLHLFAIYDENAPQPLPDFSGGTGSI